MCSASRVEFAGMLFSYFPVGGEGGGDGALIAVIDEGEGLLRHKDTLQVRGVEPELDIGQDRASIG